MAQLQDVEVLFRDGHRVKGRLLAPFSPQSGEVVISVMGKRENVRLDGVCCISFLLNPAITHQKRFPTEVVERIVTVSGDEFLMRVLPNEMELKGFMATPEREDTPVQRVYFVADAVKSRELTDSLGAILDKERIVDRSHIEQVLDAQHKLGNRRVGEILAEEEGISQHRIERIIANPSAEPGKRRMLVGEVLVSEGLITRAQLDRALEKQKVEKDKRLGEILVDSGAISEEALIIAMAIKLRMRFIDLSHITPSPEALSLVKAAMARKYNVLPIHCDDKKLIVAVFDPDLGIIDDLSFLSNRRVIPVLATRTQISEMIETLYREDISEDVDAFMDIELAGIEEEESAESTLVQLSEAEQAPIVRMVNRTIIDGVNARASDIHIFPVEGGTRIDFRINGLLQQYMMLPEAVHRPMLSRIKVVAGMDIAERRQPQDGRIQMRRGEHEVEFRVSVMPGVPAESVVLRILDKGDKPMALEELGLADEDVKSIQNIIHSSHGFFLVTGPTGSGKSTTMLAAMGSLTNLPKRLISIEDPVEAKVPGVNQVQINAAIGFTFAKALRNLLRHDPDVIMVGEIRDQETAAVAVESAMSGHMLLSSLHTNDAAGAFPRLINLGVEPFLVADTVKGVMAQLLIPRLCDKCRYEHPADSEVLTLLRMHDMQHDGTDYRSRGCKACNNTGVSGRVLVYELLEVNEEIAHLIALNSSEFKIKKAVHKAGMVSMADMALAKARQGLISLDYVLPLLFTRDLNDDPEEA